MTEPIRIKPVIILPTGKMSRDDIQELRNNELCVVECETPEDVRFMEPPPGDYSVAERACIQLFRHLKSKSQWNIDRSRLLELWADILMKGSPLESPPEPKKLK